MKIRFFLLATFGFLSGVLVYGCIVVNGESYLAETIYGSGTLISEQRQVPIFDQIHLQGSGKVILTRAERHSVRVETDDNIMPNIRSEVENGTLVISHKIKNLRPTELKFYIAATNLEGVSIAGSGDIIGKDEFGSDRFYTDIAGSGDIALKLYADRLESSISGSGSIYLSGSSVSYDATITGSGDIDAFDLQTKNSSIVITGSGSCRVNVLDNLTAKITGSGDVMYRGYPRLNQSITGSGKVKDRN